VTFPFHLHGTTHTITAFAHRSREGGRFTLLFQLGDPLFRTADFLLRRGAAEEAFALNGCTW
jgi:hypothetical protein